MFYNAVQKNSYDSNIIADISKFETFIIISKLTSSLHLFVMVSQNLINVKTSKS